MNIFFKISLFFFVFYDKLILVDLGALLSCGALLTYAALFSYYSQTKPIKYDNLNTTNKKIIKNYIYYILYI